MTELAEERHAVQAALKKYNMYGWLWEDDAGDRIEPIQSTFLSEVAACDIYIGLFWLEYGPYTIEEFEHAHKNMGKPCLIYEKCIDTHQREPLLDEFLAHIQQVNNPNGLTVCRFETSKQLAKRVQRDVMSLLIRTFRGFHQKTLPQLMQFEPITSSLTPSKNVVVNTVNINISQTNKTLPDSGR